MAHKKGQGSTENGRDSNAQHLGIKLYGGQAARTGCIILHQRGTKWKPGKNAFRAKDDAIMAGAAGKGVFPGPFVVIFPSH